MKERGGVGVGERDFYIYMYGERKGARHKHTQQVLASLSFKGRISASAIGVKRPDKRHEVIKRERELERRE